jgi:DNA-binding beta-propeller fold protein YncE
VPHHRAAGVAPALMSSPQAACVAAVLGDELRRVVTLGGRRGAPRSMGSVYAGAVTRFLGGSLRGVVSRVIDTPGVKCVCNGIAVSRDGSALLVSDVGDSCRAICVVSVAHSHLVRGVGRRGSGRLQFKYPRQVWVAADGFVFVADYLNHRVQVLTPALAWHGVIGDTQVGFPTGVCANADVVVVAEGTDHCVTVLRRSDGGVITQFGSLGSGDGQLHHPGGLCFVSGDRRVAVADQGNNRVSVFGVDGGFVRHVGVGVLRRPAGVASSAYDELVVADTDNCCIRVFSDVGELLLTLGRGRFTAVTIHDGTLYAHEFDGDRCIVWA